MIRKMYFFCGGKINKHSARLLCVIYVTGIIHSYTACNNFRGNYNCNKDQRKRNCDKIIPVYQRSECQYRRIESKYKSPAFFKSKKSSYVINRCDNTDFFPAAAFKDLNGYDYRNN